MMSLIHRVGVIVVLLCLTACASPYQALTDGEKSGYSEQLVTGDKGVRALSLVISG